jgi:hypothetical protein
MHIPTVEPSIGKKTPVLCADRSRVRNRSEGQKPLVIPDRSQNQLHTEEKKQAGKEKYCTRILFHNLLNFLSAAKVTTLVVCGTTKPCSKRNGNKNMTVLHMIMTPSSHSLQLPSTFLFIFHAATFITFPALEGERPRILRSSA